MNKTLKIKTNKRDEMVDITNMVQRVIEEANIKNGLCTIFIPHTTAGITINENADPDVKRDMIMELNKIVPFVDGYQHIEGNSAAHIKSSILGFTQTIIISNSRLLLGTWQGIYFCEFDGPRTRKFIVNIVAED
ncbi:secondary thiamine-phosphate synthase enzyme YjbQ [Clostridiaceae bacterium M8S5]|nr:secondary thiamine-phosphate synthase enzyme YjbQ [Clostridiaceae bacterium M8S5]